MLSGSDETSHKRVIALSSFAVLVGITILDAKGYHVNDKLIYVFASLAGGNSILTVIEKFGKKKDKAF